MHPLWNRKQKCNTKTIPKHLRDMRKKIGKKRAWGGHSLCILMATKHLGCPQGQGMHPHGALVFSHDHLLLVASTGSHPMLDWITLKPLKNWSLYSAYKSLFSVVTCFSTFENISEQYEAGEDFIFLDVFPPWVLYYYKFLSYWNLLHQLTIILFLNSFRMLKPRWMNWLKLVKEMRDTFRT